MYNIFEEEFEEFKRLNFRFNLILKWMFVLMCSELFSIH